MPYLLIKRFIRLGDCFHKKYNGNVLDTVMLASEK